MVIGKATLLGGLARYVARLRSPQLLFLVGGLFFADLLVPDLIPWIDEIILGLLTVLLSRWKKPEAEVAKPPPKNVTPGR